MEGGRNQNKGAESTSTSAQQQAKETAPPTNLPATIPLEFLEQMLKTLRPDVNVSQTLAYLTQADQPSTSAAAQAPVTPPEQTMPSAAEGLTGNGGQTLTESITEAVVEEEPLHQSIRKEEDVVEVRVGWGDGATAAVTHRIREVPEGDTAQSDMGGKTTAGSRNPEQGKPLKGDVIPLQIDDFPGELTSPLPVLSPPVEISYSEEAVHLLEGPSRLEELQVIDLCNEAGAGEGEPE